MGKFLKGVFVPSSSKGEVEKVEANIAVGNLVIIVDKSLARNHWKMGRVETIHSVGAHVRTVDIR